MTKEEFQLKEKEWQRRLEDLLIEMMQFTNHKSIRVLQPAETPVTKWYLEATQIMRDSFETDGAMLIPVPGPHMESSND